MCWSHHQQLWQLSVTHSLMHRVWTLHSVTFENKGGRKTNSGRSVEHTLRTVSLSLTSISFLFFYIPNELLCCNVIACKVGFKWLSERKNKNRKVHWDMVYPRRHIHYRQNVIKILLSVLSKQVFKCGNNFGSNRGSRNSTANPYEDESLLWSLLKRQKDSLFILISSRLTWNWGLEHYQGGS